MSPYASVPMRSELAIIWWSQPRYVSIWVAWLLSCTNIFVQITAAAALILFKVTDWSSILRSQLLSVCSQSAHVHPSEHIADIISKSVKHGEMRIPNKWSFRDHDFCIIRSRCGTEGTYMIRSADSLSLIVNRAKNTKGEAWRGIKILHHLQLE